MKWDVKIALYLFLAYAFYGISYLFSNGDYVVPLPMLFIFIPIVSLTFLFTSGLNKYTIFFLLLPLSVMSDKLSEFSFALSEIGALVSIVAWVALGIILFFDNYFKKQFQKNKLLLVFPIACISAICFILNNEMLSISIFLLIGVASGLIIREDAEKYQLPIKIRRVILLSSFISWMYLVTMLSVYSM